MPSVCLLCGRDGITPPICNQCERDLPLAPPYSCPTCAETTSLGERCGACLKDPPAFTATYAPFKYEFPLDKLIQALKYGHHTGLARWFGDALAQRLAHTHWDALIPLPLHVARLRERGFNQSVEIGRPIAKQLDTPLICDALSRSRHTAPQAELPVKARHRNIKKAFECNRDFSGMRLLLIDDVMTTGATLREASRILKLHGASEIAVAVVARSHRHRAT